VPTVTVRTEPSVVDAERASGREAQPDVARPSRSAGARAARARATLRARAVPLLAALFVGGALVFAVIRSMRPPAVAVQRVRRESVTRVLALTGRIEPRESVRVVPRVGGEVVAIFHDEGDRVRAGEPLARIENTAERARVTQALAAIAAREAEVTQSETDLARTERLVASGAVPRVQGEEARVRLASGREELRRLRAAAVEAKERLAEFVLTSPFDGTILVRGVDRGQNVAADTLVFELATTDDVRVETEVDEELVAFLRPGLAAKVAPPHAGDDARDARVVFVSPRIDRQTGGATVRLEFQGERPPWPMYLSVDVNIVVGEDDAALTIPRRAVVDARRDAHVLRVEDGRVSRRAVRVVDWPAERVVVTHGLDEGESVVLDPGSTREGVRVREASQPDDGRSGPKARDAL
jgi:RND family efflux transporter MFP subunit